MQGGHDYNPYQAPQTGPDEWAPRARLSGVKWLLFSFEGRIARRQYWAGFAGLICAVGGATGIIALVSGAIGAFNQNTGTAGPSAALLAPGVLALAIVVPYCWIVLALDVKRWHDRGKPGIWALLRFVPCIGPIWTFVELGCLQGTPDSNPYGDPP